MFVLEEAHVLRANAEVLSAESEIHPREQTT